MWKNSMKYKVTLREHHHHRSGSAKPLILTRSSFFCFGWEPDLGKSTSHLGGERLRASHRLSVKVPQRKTSYLTISENDLKLDLRAPFWCQQWRNALRSGSTCSKVLKQKLRSVMRYWISWKKHPKILPALWYTIMVARDMCIFLLKSPKILKITGYVAGLETKTSIPIFFILRWLGSIWSQPEINSLEYFVQASRQVGLRGYSEKDGNFFFSGFFRSTTNLGSITWKKTNGGFSWHENCLKIFALVLGQYDEMPRLLKVWGKGWWNAPIFLRENNTRIWFPKHLIWVRWHHLKILTCWWVSQQLIVQECETWVQYFLKNLAKHMVMEILSTSDMPRPFELSKVETSMWAHFSCFLCRWLDGSRGAETKPTV